MLVRVRSRESGTAGRRSCSCKPNLKDSKWPVTKPISPIYRTREACITTTRLSSTGTRTSMTLTRCVFQTLRWLRLAALAFTLTLTLTLPTLARSHARPHASTGSRNRRGSGSSPGGVPILAQVGVQPGRRALGRSSHAQTRRSLTRACRALALVALSRSLARSFARIIRFFSPTLRGQIQYHSRAHRKNRHAKIVRQDNVLIAPEPPSFWNGMSDLSNISWHVAVWFCLGSICWIVNGQYACVLEL